MSETNDFDGEICEGKNKNNIRCQFCSSLILKPKTANYIQQEYSLPLMHQKNTKSVDDIEKEVLGNFWSVDDMFTFENVGFSNTVQNVKFLICADCEMGPVGYHDLATKKSYIALQRIKHDSAYLKVFYLEGYRRPVLQDPISRDLEWRVGRIGSYKTPGNNKYKP